MVSASKPSLVVAASMAAVEALKDQVGLCRWNYAIRSIHQHAKSSSLKQAPKSHTAPPTSQSSQVSRRMFDDHSASLAAASVSVKKTRETEKAENVMNLLCWGPN